MSLIQEALSKTQKTGATAEAEIKIQPKPEVRPQRLRGLDDLDREVEQKLSEIGQNPKHASVPAPKRAYVAEFAWVIAGALVMATLIYWFINRPASEPVPAAVVDIQKSTFVNKPHLAQKPAVQEFVTLAEASDARGKYKLGGIAWGGDQPYALINGEIVRVGDRVERKVTVHQIEKNYVDLDYRGDLIRLELRR